MKLAEGGYHRPPFTGSLGGPGFHTPVCARSAFSEPGLIIITSLRLSAADMRGNIRL